MSVLGQRVPHGKPRIVGRSPADYAQELEECLGDVVALAAVVNTIVTILPPEILTVGAAAPDTSSILENQIFGR